MSRQCARAPGLIELANVWTSWIINYMMGTGDPKQSNCKLRSTSRMVGKGGCI